MQLAYSLPHSSSYPIRDLKQRGGSYGKMVVDYIHLSPYLSSVDKEAEKTGSCRLGAKCFDNPARLQRPLKIFYNRISRGHQGPQIRIIVRVFALCALEILKLIKNRKVIQGADPPPFL